MAVVAMAAATTTILALVAGLVAALRMMHVSANHRSGTSESVANETTKADNNGTIENSSETDIGQRRFAPWPLFTSKVASLLL